MVWFAHNKMIDDWDQLILWLGWPLPKQKISYLHSISGIGLSPDLHTCERPSHFFLAPARVDTPREESDQTGLAHESVEHAEQRAGSSFVKEMTSHLITRKNWPRINKIAA
jgi:hypothetical protein